jgi:hypothetical protein
MAFRKSGVAPIADVRCSCGSSLTAGENSCPSCKKTIIPEELKTQVEDLATEEDKSKVK